LTQTYVLDTSALLHLIRGKELGEQLDRAFGLRDALYRHTISIVTHGELKALAERNGWGDQKKDILQKALDELVTVDVASRSIVAAYVRVEAANRTAQGGERKMGHNDMWIAATSLVLGLPLITTDEDFRHLNGQLITVHWVDPTLGHPNMPRS
jgi:tRNA(fMet)-specific endonuclease VapC